MIDRDLRSIDPDELQALITEVERQSGAMLPDRCTGQVLSYQLAGKESKVTSCECRNKTMFVSVYDPTTFAKKKGAHDNGGGFIRSCALCDSMGSWPRYREAVEAVEND